MRSQHTIPVDISDELEVSGGGEFEDDGRGGDLKVLGGGVGLRLGGGRAGELDDRERDDEVPEDNGGAVAVGGGAKGEINGVGVAS